MVGGPADRMGGGLSHCGPGTERLVLRHPTLGRACVPWAGRRLSPGGKGPPAGSPPQSHVLAGPARALRGAQSVAGERSLKPTPRATPGLCPGS